MNINGDIRSAEFRKGREASWVKLDVMLTKIEKRGLSGLSAEEAEEMPLLYRNTLSALSVARTIVLDRNLLLYLENLSLRAYLIVYGPHTGVLTNLKKFVAGGFSKEVRALKYHFLLAVFILFAGVIAGYVIVMDNINNFSLIVPEVMSNGRGPESTAEELLSGEIFSEWSGFAETFIVFANFLFRHNTMVGILCFGLGFVFGIPTILLLIYNGLIIGAFVGLHKHKGIVVDFIGWLSIHGVTEILAILLCAAAGLVLAEKIIFPGRLSRRASLSIYGRKAASVVAGCFFLFFIAGIFEGGFRQLINITFGRYLFALATAAFWYFYFVLYKRSGYDKK